MKGRCLIVLYHRMYKLGISKGLSYSELAAQAGVSKDYVGSKVCLWVTWKYINKKAGTNASGRPVYVYSIAARGVKFIQERMGKDVLADMVQEIIDNRTITPY
jgi:hypothetical protein